ncbi:MAG: serine hydrolase [Dehalococcoidia bacterium]
MREAARPAARGVRRHQSITSTWFVAGFVALVSAAFYLALSVQQAFTGDSDGPLPAVSPATQLTVAEAVPRPNPTVVPQPDDAVQLAPPPKPGLAPAVGDPALLSAIETAAGEDRDHIAVSVKRISDGRSAALNGDYQFYAASTFKLAILYEAEVRHAKGELEYTDTLLMSEEDAAEDLGTSGYLHFEPDGSITIGNLLEAMITVSDNSSAVTLLHEFGGGNIDDTLRSIGLKTMTVNQVELWTTADDLARLMEAIYTGESVGPTERAHMRELLLAQNIRNGIPGALASEVDEGLRIGNKTGTWPGAQHDVAFVEAQSGAFIIAILTDGSYEGWQALQRVTQAVYAALSHD